MFFFSCGIPLGKLQPISDDVIPEVQPIFQANTIEIVYDMSVGFLNSHNSGILAVVRDSNNLDHYRTVFMAKVGFKLFDFSFKPSSMLINHIAPQLDRKLIRKILEKDLRMLFDPIEKEHQGFFHSDRTGEILWRNKKGKDIYHLYLDQEGKIYRVDKGSKSRSTVRIDLKYDHPGFPSQVIIQHKKIPFLMRLNRIAAVN